MSNYSQIKGIIDAAVYENHQQAITGDAMNTVLNGMVSQLGAHYKYKGYASPATDPGAPDENVFYLATEQGTYPNFGGLSLTKPLGVFKWDGSWTLDQIAIDTGTAAGLLEKVNANTAAINAINAKIPPEASTDNKLADKAYVDRAVATNTGTFVGTFGSVSELPTDDIKANDYAYVVEDGVFKRYKYNGTEWLYEYSLDNTAFSDYVKAVNITAQGIVFDFAAGTDKTFLIASGGGLSYTGNGLEITSLKSSLVISALGYTPFDASQFTAQNIVSTLGNTAVKEALHALNADTAAVANKVAHPLYFYDADSDTPRTYDGSAVVSVTIPSAEQIALWDKICSLFDIDTAGDVYVTGERGFFTNSFLSARGADEESGGGGGLDVTAMWAALAANTSEQINLSHLPSIPTSKISGLEAASVGYATSAGTADKVKYNLTVKNDGGVSGVSDKVYNGSSAVTINIPTTLPASDVYDWAKQPAKPSYTFAEIGSKPTTLAGYGITDGVNTASASGNLTAKVTGHSLAIGVASGYEIPSMTRTALWDKICALFDVDENGDVYVTGNRGFWSPTFLSARGSDPEAGQGGSGGLDIDAMWDALGTSGTQKIDASHIPALGLLSGTVSNAQLANSSITVAGVEVPLGSEVTTAQIATALTGAGYKLTDTTYGLATDTTAGLVKTGYLTQVGTKNYGVKLNSLGQMYVSVPWTDTVTTLESLGITATAAELNYVDGVTSNIQTQLNAKANASALTAYALKDGSNASGTWPISISGTAADASALGGIAATKYMYHYRTNGYNIDTGSTSSPRVIETNNPAGNKPGTSSWVQVMQWGSGDQAYGFQMANSYNVDQSVYYRAKIAGIWYGWKTLLDTSNYTSTLDSRYLLKSSYTAADILAKLKTVDGSGSGLDADLLDGYHVGTVTRMIDYYKTNISNVGWYRVFTSKESNAYGIDVILYLWRSYNATNNEAYTFSISIAYNGAVCITQLSGTYGRHLIDKIRVVSINGTASNNSPTYIDFHVGASSGGNSYCVSGRGVGTFQAPAAVSDSVTGIVTEFATTGGVSCNYGFTGAISGNATSATKLATARTLWGQSFDGSGNVTGTMYNISHIYMSGNVFLSANAVGPYLTGDSTGLTVCMHTAANAWSSTLMHIDSSGNVGLGTSSPTSKLDVRGMVSITPTTGGYWNEGIRLHPYNNWTSLMFCGTDNTGATGTSANSWSMHGYLGNFYINRNGSNTHTGYELCNVGGNWGIGTVTPAAKLHVVGTIYATTGIWSSGWLSFSDLSSTSDRKFKDGITPLDRRDALSVIHALKPSTWTWNALSKVKGRSAGFVAQDVAGVLPDAIREIGEDKHLALNYQMLHAYEVAALQEHDDEIARLRKRVDFLEDELKRARSWQH